MSETWIIKDAAPVDTASYTLNQTDILFVSGSESFTGIRVNTISDGVYLTYYKGSTRNQVASYVVSSENVGFSWGDIKYKTLTFDTTPTGALSAWLQKNAYKQIEYLTKTSDLISVANAIRAKGDTTVQLVYPDGFVSAIQDIETTKPEQTKSITITSNGTTTVTPDDGYTLNSATITTNVPSSGINGTLINNFVVEDGILQFEIPQEDYSNYRNYYIKKSTVKFGLFLSNITNNTSAAVWRVTHETSSDWQFSTNYVNVTKEGVMYNFTINLADSGGYYYDGTVSVYVITA